mmetsp:Transcript_20312/g.78006  ORF Transcript_20312/g.78006 Transcript_20312/m.78006 type:complete len:228 (+) Transcript_20312:810-1493(+)
MGGRCGAAGGSGRRGRLLWRGAPRDQARLGSREVLLMQASVLQGPSRHRGPRPQSHSLLGGHAQVARASAPGRLQCCDSRVPLTGPRGLGSALPLGRIAAGVHSLRRLHGGPRRVLDTARWLRERFVGHGGHCTRPAGVRCSRVLRLAGAGDGGDPAPDERSELLSASHGGRVWAWYGGSDLGSRLCCRRTGACQVLWRANGLRCCHAHVCSAGLLWLLGGRGQRSR